MRKSLLLVTAVAAAVVLSGVRVYADDAYDIETGYSVNQYAQYDNTAGYDPSHYPMISVIGSSPSTIDGYSYYNYAALAQDHTGSLDLYISATTLTTLTANANASLAVGDGINAAGQWNPYHQIPEFTFVTTPASNNYLNVTSTGNVALDAGVGPKVVTVSQGDVGSLTAGLQGYYLEIQNATISGNDTNSPGYFPTPNQGNWTYTLTDSSGSMTLYDWVTSYSDCGAMGSNLVPTGPVNVYGMVSVYGYGATASPEFIPFAISGVVPEPSAFLLAGMGLLGLLALWRRRS